MGNLRANRDAKVMKIGENVVVFFKQKRLSDDSLQIFVIKIF